MDTQSPYNRAKTCSGKNLQAIDNLQNMGNPRKSSTLHSVKYVMYVNFFTNQVPAIQIAVPKRKSINAKFYKDKVILK
jgi:hypothetical protein